MGAPVVPRKSASTILEELRIEAPDEIDLEAIAAYCAATVVYKPLSGCEARITGLGDKAIITVRENSKIERQRYSIGHELGHWQYDRNRVGFSCTERMYKVEWAGDNPERRANRFAANLLLPPRLFKPRAKGKAMTFASVRVLGDEFTTSLTATAITFVEHGSFPSMLICTDSAGYRKWYVTSRDVKLRPHQRAGRDTVARELGAGTSDANGPAEVCSDGWIDHPDADRYSITEDSIRSRDGLVLSMLWWRDEAQLIELERDEES